MTASTSPPVAEKPLNRPAALPPLPQVLAVGPWEEPLFAAARAEMATTAHWHSAGSLSAARIKLNQLPTTDLLLLAQPRPNFYRQSELDRLQSELPLLRTVVVAGSWCEGELRTGAPLEGAMRLYWYELSRWWQAALRKLASGEAPPWSEPLGSSAAGRWSATEKSPLAKSGTVVVDTPDVAVWEMLESVLRVHGLAAVWHRKGSVKSACSSLTGAIWDGGQLGSDELRQLSQFCDTVAAENVPVVVLLDYPRVEHLRQAREAGATVVVGKPFGVAELVGFFGGD